MKRKILKTFSLLVVLVMLSASVSYIPQISLAANGQGEDPIPENIGILKTSQNISISYTRVFSDENGVIPVGAGVGAHGGHETRIVRTQYGTYATFITNATGEPTSAHPNWVNGVATFEIVKVTATGFERIFSAEYPQAAGSCTPNVIQGENGIVYVTIIADDKDRRAAAYQNGVWLQVYKLDTATDTVTLPGGTAKFDHTTNPGQDHGYGYSQPIFDFKNGKMYALTCGGEAPGYLAWWIYDLKTDRWNSTCHTVQLETRRCYINGYADGNGGFTIVIERCAPVSTLSQYLGVQFRQTSGYMWDALYVMHVANPNVNRFTDTVIVEPEYTAEGYNNSGKNNPDSASHYGYSGCTYLDDQNRLHVIYSHKNGNTKKIGIYHAIYDLNGNELYNELIPTTLLAKNGTSGTAAAASFAMTQDTDGTYYVLVENSSANAGLIVWSSPANDGINFTKVLSSTTLTDKDGGTVSKGKFIIGNSRNYTDRDGYVPLMFEGSSGGTECFYYTSVALPHAGEGIVQPHIHTWNAGVVTTPATCKATGVKTYTCTGCGETKTEQIPKRSHSWNSGVVTTPASCSQNGVRTYTCTACGDTYTEQIAKTSHTWDTGVITVKPTYTEQGVKTYTCGSCGATYTETVPELDPMPGDVNGDGKINSRDLAQMKKYIAGSILEDDIVLENSDLYIDGSVNSRDVSQLKKLFVS